MSTENTVESQEPDFDNEENFFTEEVLDGEVVTDGAGPSQEVDTREETVTSIDISQPLTREEAEALTEHIRSTADVLYVLLSRAHAGKAWEALGYKSFAEYVKEEFDISRSRAYQLLDQAKVVAEISAVAPEGTDVRISEAAARDLKHMINEITPEVAEATENLSPSEASQVIDDLINDYRNREDETEDEDDDLEDDDTFYGGSGNGDYRPPLDDEDDDDEDDLSDIDDLLGGANDASEVRHRFESMYALFTSLTALREMPDADKVIAWIPEERRYQITSSLPTVQEWLEKFAAAWREQDWYKAEVSEQSATGESVEAAEDFEVDPDVEDVFEEFSTN